MFILNTRNKIFHLVKNLPFFLRKISRNQDKQNLRSFRTKKERNQWQKTIIIQRDRLSLCLSLARGGSSSNERWSTRKGKNRAKKHPRSSKLWCALAFSPREKKKKKKKKKKKRRNDSSSLRLFFFLIAFAVTKNLSSSSFEINLHRARCETKFTRTWTLVALRPATDAICWVAANMMFM